MITEEFIRFVLEDKPHLEPIFHSAFDIPRRITLLDPNCFVVYNNYREQFELHSLESYFPDMDGITTQQMVLKNLEPGVLDKIIDGSHIFNGYDVHDDMHRSEELYRKNVKEIHKQSMERATKSTIDDMAGRKKVY